MKFTIDFHKHYVSNYEKVISKYEHYLDDVDISDSLYYEKTNDEILSNLYQSEDDAIYDMAQYFITQVREDVSGSDFAYSLGVLKGHYKIALIAINANHDHDHDHDKKSDFDYKEAIHALHEYANQLNDLYDEELEYINDNDKVPYSINHIRNDINLLVEPIADNLKSYFLSSRHGGARLNAGRKKEEPTRQMRIPESLYTLINDLKIAYKDLTDEDKKTCRSSLEDVFK